MISVLFVYTRNIINNHFMKVCVCVYMCVRISSYWLTFTNIFHTTELNWCTSTLHVHTIYEHDRISIVLTIVIINCATETTIAKVGKCFWVHSIKNLNKWRIKLLDTCKKMIVYIVYWDHWDAVNAKVIKLIMMNEHTIVIFVHVPHTLAAAISAKTTTTTTTAMSSATSLLWDCSCVWMWCGDSNVW